MTDVLLVRHAPTDWNELGRLQGRIDRPLSPSGVARLREWRLPRAFGDAPVACSPLRRARQTAERFGQVVVEPRLVEMAWGAWEGQRLADLRAADPVRMATLEQDGVDFRPDGGESPREVMARLASLFAELVPTGRRVLVTHKGVIRAALALATGWAMTSKPPVRLRSDDALALRLDRLGRPSPEVAVLSLVERVTCGS
ncbi:MAG: histidine phosphatase family protein [Pseudomonadota bacterium]